MGKLLLIKHSNPILDSEKPSNQWVLSEEGKQRALLLANQLENYQFSQIFSSVEPKARETADIVANNLGKKVLEKENLHEHRRESNRIIYPRDEFENIMKKFFHYPDQLIFGEETARQAKGRFEKAVLEITNNIQHDEDLVIITHGTVITLFVSNYNFIDCFQFWNSLGMPSVVELKLDDFQLNQVIYL
ncbi:broad specificity phosphatase PhoE [Melghiribacillus thermohalophilus]|uniref:Broad specificity phosphatase PhoE n=1 Tax=Melghiribacillus thermohalophilus TaxID=1324956 RepID=A0A4R3N294_9BACI|nr:histidine phosphatase family protein [Melghiribacillus thermohalophilus]TCT22377.1 broad specificity phosphatase PhoE [Melghiribacillus thermohalophilus]